VWFPAVVFVQLLLSLGLALIVSALTVHFRDIKDILANLLTLWFFATPIIYPMSQLTDPSSATPGWARTLIYLNPFTHLAISYQEILFYPGPFGHWKWLMALGVASALLFLFGYFLFDRLRDSFAEEV
jgi:lipopolysaccharide transport system permease protein